MNKISDQNSVKVVQHLPFDVEAVPQNNTSGIFDTTTDAAPKPVNIKIRVRNTEQITRGHGVISVPMLSSSRPKKVRLVSSDQTIISFDLFMENENVKKVPKKQHYKFFQLFKPSGCFNNETDDDVYPYVPSSSNETYRAKSASNVSDLQDDKIFEEKFTLKKNLPAILTTNTALRTPNFLGKCKPGGCLDPPFSEDKYIYKPKSKMLAFDQKNIKNHGFTDENHNNSKTHLDKVLDKPASILQSTLSKSSIEEVYSHSLITYPALSCSEIRVQEENRKSKIRTSIENKVRISINELSDTYFMPPRKRKSKINEKMDTEFLRTQILRSDNYDTQGENSLSSQKQPSPHMFTNELFNLAPDAKILNTNENDKTQKSSEIDLLKVDNNAMLSTLSNTIIEHLILKETNSISDKNVTDAASLSIYKDAKTAEGMPAQDYQASKDTSNSNEILNELNLMHIIPDEPMNNDSQENQKQCKLQPLIENQASGSISLNTDENKMKIAIQDSKKKSKSNEILNELKHKHGIPNEPMNNDSQENQKQCKLQSSIENQASGSISLNTHENKMKIAIQDSKKKSKSNEILNELKLMHRIPDEPMNNDSQENQKQCKLQSSIENQASRSIPLNTDENKMKIAIQDSKDKSKSNEILNELKLMHRIPDVSISNHSVASQGQYKLQSSVENQDSTTRGSDFVNTDKNTINFERDLSTNKNSLIDFLPGAENHQQFSFTDSANSYHKIGHIQPKESNHSQLSLIENTQSREIINHQQYLQQNKPSQDEVSTVSTLDKEKCDSNDSFRKDKSNRIDNKYINRDISMLTVNNASDKQLVYHQRVRLLSEDLISSIVSAEPKLSEKRTSTTATDLKMNNNTIAGNISSNKEIPTPTLQEKLSSRLKIQGKETISKKPIYYSRNLSDVGETASPSDYLDVHNSDDVVQPFNNIVPNQIQSLKNVNIDDRYDLSHKYIKSIHKETIETKPQLQLNNINLSSIISDDKKPYSYVPQDTMVTIYNSTEDRTEILSEHDPVFTRKSSKLKERKKEYSTNLKEALINDDNNHLMKPHEGNLTNVRENVLHNKNSLIKIDLGFYSFESDKNETTIKSYDTSKTLEMNPEKKITIIKSVIRKNGSEIRIPVNSEMDLTLQIKKSFDKGSISKRYIDGTKQSTDDRSNKDIILQETLASVYENLVPVENIIQNLKQEADCLAQQQLLFREILNNLNTKSERLIKTSNKCSCNKYWL